MRLSILKSAAVTAIMALAACTTTEETGLPGDQGGLALGRGEDVIRISLSNTTSTRAARPMGSSKPDNNINRIAFKFLSTAGETEAAFTLDGVIDPVTGESKADYAVENNVLKLPGNYDDSEICVKFSGLTEGSYKIIAYGYNYTEGSDTDDEFPYDISPKGSDYLLKCENVQTVQEIFAGCNGENFIGVNVHGKFEEVPVIKLERQVAGLMAYLSNVPVFVNNTKVSTITISSKANVTGFYIPNSLVNGGYNGMNIEGWNNNDWDHYLTFDMTKASNYDDYDPNHLNSYATYKFDTQEDGFLLANETAPINNLECNEDTLFGSRFLLAYPSNFNCATNSPKCATLNICYWDKDEKLIICVPLRSGGGSGDDLSADSYQYHILCNNFYSIGTKSDLNDDQENNSPADIDEPNGYDYAEISITNDWSNKHDLIN